MSGDKLAAPTQKQRRPFTHLSPSLAQLVEDRFEEDQYDQAVDLLEQLNLEGIRPSKSLIRKLIALSLCSLAPGQVASTSRWTLDHQLHDIAARLLTHSKSSKSNRDVMKAASSASDKPSQRAVLTATSLLLQYSKGSSSLDASERNESILARHVLEALPSRRKPLESPHADSPKSPRRPNRGSPRSDEGQEDGSFEQSSIERWARADLHRAEDIWDLLCGQRFSNSTESEDVSLNRVSEFWMNDSERKRYQRQLQTSASSRQRLEDRLRQLQRKKLNGASSSDSDGDDSSSDSDGLPGNHIPGRTKKRPLKPKSKRHADSPLSKTTKRARPSKPVPLHRDDEQAQNRQILMTEGAWRTLSVLLVLWRQSSMPTTSAKGDTDEGIDDDPPLLWQFPHSHLTKSTSRVRSRAAIGSDTTDEIGRALDIAFSFTDILPVYTPSSSGTEDATDLFDTSKSIETRGDARPISSVPQAELLHRQQITHQKEERNMAARAEIAAQLLLSIYTLVERKCISSVAFTEGVSDRIKSLRAHELHYLMLPILDRQPLVVTTVLSTYLRDATQTHPDHRKTASRSLIEVRKNDREPVTVYAALAYAVPLAEKTSVFLASARDTDPDAKSVCDFLALNRLELDSSAESSFTLTMPTRSESCKRIFVQRQTQKQIKSESHEPGKKSSKVDSKNADAGVLTQEMKMGGLTAFAHVRTMQMEARDRINQMKFLVARALAMMHVNAKFKKEARPSSQGANQSLNGTISAPAHQDDEAKKESQSSTGSQEPAFEEFLSELSKAFDQDAAEFKGCLSAMRSHLSKDSAAWRQHIASTQGMPSGNRTGSSGLPSFETMVERCQRYHDTAQNLAHSTRLLKDSVL